MEVSELVESFDSLWFFSNVVTCNEKVSQKSILDGCGDGDSARRLSESEVQMQKQLLLSPIVEKEGLKTPNSEKSCELSEKLQPLRMARSDPIEVQAFPGRKRKKTKKKSKTKFKTDLDERGRILTEIDLGTLNAFDDLVDCNAVNMEAFTEPFLVVEQLCCGFQRFANGRQSPFISENMPPIDDGMAMKEHLKLWAHAVANTVR